MPGYWHAHRGGRWVGMLGSVLDHVRLLRAAGYAAAGTVWQHGEDTVVTGVR